MTRKEALAAGAMFYSGKVCPKHPELAGQRRAASGNCHACVVERMRKHRKKNRTEYNRERRERYSAIKAGRYVPRKYRSAAREKATSAVARADG